MNRKLSAIIFLCVAAVTFEIVMYAVGLNRQAVLPAPAEIASPGIPGEGTTIVPTTADLQPDEEPQTPSTPVLPRSAQTMPSPQTIQPGAPTTAPADDDAVLLQARRELRQAQTDVSIPSADAVTSPDGKIHLKSGGTISAQEWQAARNRVP